MQRVHKRMCLILSGYWDRIVWIYKHKSIMTGNNETEISYC